MAGKKKQPVLRFKGFSGDWEERKLVEVSEDTFGGGTPSTSVDEYWNGDIAWIQSSDLAEEKLSNIVPRKWITENGLRASVAKLVPEKSIAIVTRVGVGKLAFMPYKYATSQDFLSLSKLKIDDWFGVYSIWKKLQSELHAVQGTSIKGITKEELLTKSIMVPIQSEEQSRIGGLFQHLDNLITLQQRKLDKLSNIKKALLQKMFPKNGAAVPEIRFKGFSEDWEQRELGELLQIKDSARIPNEQWGETGIRYLRSSDLENNGQDGALFISSEAYEAYKSKTGAPERGDVLFNSGGNIGLSLLKTDNTPIYVQGGAILYIRTSQSKDVDGSYLNIYFSTARMKKYINITSAGGTIKHFTLKPANAAPFIYPSIIEQKKIGEFFTHLDNLITLHQRKLEKLKNIKKACLEKMFV